ncbi:MAG: HAD family hydrolase [Candidatus Aenigmarchaeota archaeon]|nr:HAD family hydrolase [Candidatus Aenigmarchaeota archaeon]
MAVKLVIFDLDDTLIKTSAITKECYATARDYLKEKGAKESTLLHLDEKFNSPVSYHKSVKKLEEELYRDGLKKDDVYRSIDIFNAGQVSGKLEMVDGAKEVLEGLKDLRKSGKIKTVLVTSSKDAKVQNYKIKQFSLSKYFDDICIDNYQECGKGVALEKYQIDNKLQPEEVIVIGDKISDEIKYANLLGMKTVRILEGRHSVAIPKKGEEHPQIEIEKIADFLKILKERLG